MQSIKTKRSKKLPLIIGIFILLILAATAIYFFVLHKPVSTSPIDLNPPTKEQTEDGTSIKQQTIDRDQSSKNNPPADSAENPKTSIPVSISATNKTATVFQIRALIDSIIDNGTCKIVLKQNTTIVEKSADTAPLANTSTCKGFDIPLSELGSGSWTYTITVTDLSSNQSGSVSGTTTI